MKHILSSMVMVLVATAAAVFTTSCNNKKFQVKGNIEGAKDSMLYLENLSLDGPVAIDSAKLDEQGTFSFSVDAPTAPEFYRLRIAGQIMMCVPTPRKPSPSRPNGRAWPPIIRWKVLKSAPLSVNCH